MHKTKTEALKDIEAPRNQTQINRLTAVRVVIPWKIAASKVLAPPNRAKAKTVGILAQ